MVLCRSLALDDNTISHNQINPQRLGKFSALIVNGAFGLSLNLETRLIEFPGQGLFANALE